MPPGGSRATARPIGWEALLGTLLEAPGGPDERSAGTPSGPHAADEGIAAQGPQGRWLPQGAEWVKGSRVPQTPECPLCEADPSSPEVPVGRRGLACAQTSELPTGFQGEVFKGETWGEGLQHVR